MLVSDEIGPRLLFPDLPRGRAVSVPPWGVRPAKRGRQSSLDPHDLKEDLIPRRRRLAPIGQC
jgi:hypothetical protein